MVDFYSFHTVLWKHYFRFLCLCIQRSATVFLQNAITALQLFLSILVKRSRSPKVRLYICDLCYWYQSVSICSGQDTTRSTVKSSDLYKYHLWTDLCCVEWNAIGVCLVDRTCSVVTCCVSSRAAPAGRNSGSSSPTSACSSISPTRYKRHPHLFSSAIYCVTYNWLAVCLASPEDL